jgi:hypothetical protein
MPVAALRWPDKDPADVLDYSLDLAEFLALSTPADTVSTVAWTVPAGLTAGVQYHADGIATTWLSGGTAGTDYTVTARITTTAGRVIERSAAIYVREL